ncbi:orotidine 5'-phosphate decarboxylase [Desulfosarcina ovata subsp. sediminis]|uniref:Orotidine 5'-phosphate decarboxylase n=1 Tax=Desulfosarcina ovata subsp. sediminis TaxID=885957 RepID=A0A5K7ZER1_9BACT|nr:orotidine-5'-phosphate decarboxylase [Desulfosarcina ovata]BBO80628.1 orotidine 5'-phosphate decarboxylase [Desulfosarcina ovata subsp. sediminis]
MKTAKDHIIFPLDVPDPDIARSLVTRLADDVGMFKIGLELFIHSGPELVRWIVRAGNAKVFLDLKLHDIPATVKRAMAQVADLGVYFATVHCGESRSMLKAAVEGAAGRVNVLGVTVLTSVSAADVATAGYRDDYSQDVRRLVLKKAAMAMDAGCCGVVCSGEEVQSIKTTFGPEFQAVTPGIRMADHSVNGDDQARVVTPAMAIRRGADYLVIGRPIRDATNPQAAARAVAGEIQGALDAASPRGRDVG